MSKYVEILNVNLGYKNKTVLKEVSATISKGDFLGIVGPNGSGKTTLLRSILGWIKPLDGDLIIQPNLRFGYLPQRNNVDHLLPLSCLEITIMGLYAGKSPFTRLKSTDYEAVCTELKNVGLLHFENELKFSVVST